MFLKERLPFLNLALAAFLLLSVILLLLISQGEAHGLKKPNQEPKPRKTFPFHKVSYMPIKEDDDIDEDIKEFFEKVHHADVKTSQSQLQTDDEEDNEDFEEDKRRLSVGLFGWLFGIKQDIPDELETTHSENDNAEQIYEEKENMEDQTTNRKDQVDRTGIINWLESLVQTSESNKLRSESTKNIISEYFNRWPFNVIFPIGQPQKLVVPRNEGGKWISNQAISDEDFETLLETLPSFIINPNYINDIDCKQQIQIFHRQLRGHKMWTFQMIDASGKISSGMLRGNVNQFGDFDLCTNIKTSVKITNEVSVRIKGKYCLAHIEIQPTNANLKLAVHLLQGRGLWNSHLNDPLHFAPRYSIINWGICVPHACQPFVVQDMIDRSLQPYNHTGIYFHVEVNENDCYVRNSTHLGNLIKYNKNIEFTLGYFSMFLLAAIIAIVIENRNTYEKFFKILHNSIKPKLLQMRIEFKKFIELAKKSHLEAQAEIEMQMKKNKAKDDKSAAENESIELEKIQNLEKEDETSESTNRKECENEKEIEVLINEEQGPKDQEICEENLENRTNLLKDPVDKSKFIFKDAILSFAPKRSIETLLNIEGTDTIFPIVNIIKIFCTFMLYICLKYVMLGHLPVLNRDKLIMSLDTPISIFYRTPILYFDILLMMSGFIKAYHMCLEMEEKLHIYALKRMALNIVRFIPTLYAILLFQTWILPHLESGPLWNNIIRMQSQICEKNLWRNIFGVQNAIYFEETCSPMTVQLSVELQLYMLAPLIVWLFYCNSEIGFFLFGGINMISIALRYSRTNTEHLSPIIFHGMHLSKFYRTANLLFSSPLSRATAFLFGIGSAILLKKFKKNFEDISKIALTCGMLMAAASLIYCYWYPYSAIHLDYVYNSIDAASYASWSPLILGIAMAWIIFIISANTLKVNESGFYRLLKSRPILILSRITYPTQLSLYITVLYFTAQQKEARTYSSNDLINFSEIAIILFYAIVLAVFIDIPIQKVSKLLINQIFPDKTSTSFNNEEITEEEIEAHNEPTCEQVNEKSDSDKECEADNDSIIDKNYLAESEVETQSLAREEPQDTISEIKETTTAEDDTVNEKYEEEETSNINEEAE